MKLLKKTPIVSTLKETYKFNDKLKVTSEHFNGCTIERVTNLYIVSKVNNKSLHVVDSRGDTHVLNPNETRTTVHIVKEG